MLARKRPFLPASEMRLLDTAKTLMISGLKARSAAPASFKANIDCLESFMKSLKTWMDVAMIHIINKERAKENLSNDSSSCWSFFGKNQQTILLKEANIIEDIKKYIFDEEFQKMVKTEFAKEPRIVSLNSDFEEKNNSTSVKDNRTGNFIPTVSSHKTVETYKITFSDDSIITLHDLGPESLAKAKIIFDEKMKQLALIRTAEMEEKHSGHRLAM